MGFCPFDADLDISPFRREMDDSLCACSLKCFLNFVLEDASSLHAVKRVLGEMDMHEACKEHSLDKP